MAELSLTIGEALMRAEACAVAGDHQGVLALCRQVIAADPTILRARYLMALSEQRLGRHNAAETAYLEVLARAPDAAEAHANLALVHRARGRLDSAETAFRRALALSPDDAVGWHNLGNLGVRRGLSAMAIDAYRRALTLAPDAADAELASAEPLLALGRLAEGYGALEARWRDRGYPWGLRRFLRPSWDGRPFPGATLLVHDEQGFGDTVFFARWVAALAQAAASWGGRVALETHPPLARLLRSLPGVAEVVPRGAPLPDHQLHVPLMSLPHVARLGDADPPAGLVPLEPAPMPYLSASPRRPLDRPAGGLAVGLAWAANPGHPTGAQRSVPPGLLRPLLDLPGVRFYSLQVASAPPSAAAESAQPPQRVALDWAEGRLFDLASEIEDFADTAGLIAELDLVIAIDSAITHVACALGRETWVMIDACPGWRWAGRGARSRWYPAARLFRQQGEGNWAAVVEAIGSALQARVAR